LDNLFLDLYLETLALKYLFVVATLLSWRWFGIATDFNDVISGVILLSERSKIGDVLEIDRKHLLKKFGFAEYKVKYR
jgi:hypothetical protein